MGPTSILPGEIEWGPPGEIEWGPTSIRTGAVFQSIERPEPRRRGGSGPYKLGGLSSEEYKKGVKKFLEKMPER